MKNNLKINKEDKLEVKRERLAKKLDDDKVSSDTKTVIISKVIQTLEDNEVELVMAFEKSGVLDAGGQVIPEINQAMFTKLVKEGVIIEGMIPKLINAFSAIENGVDQVKLVSSEYLLNNKLAFTTIIKS